MSAVWGKSFIAFAGPGYAKPSESMRVDESEAAAILSGLQEQEWLAAVWTGSDRQVDYRICNARRGWTSALFHQHRIVGFYHGSYLWIAAPHRALGLSIPLILVAAAHRGGTCMPPGVTYQGYTAIGLAAHRAAYHQAILMAQSKARPLSIQSCSRVNAAVPQAHGTSPIPYQEQPTPKAGILPWTWLDFENA